MGLLGLKMDNQNFKYCSSPAYYRVPVHKIRKIKHTQILKMRQEIFKNILSRSSNVFLCLKSSNPIRDRPHRGQNLIEIV